MPIRNEVVVCINHPEKPMLPNSQPVVMHPVHFVDGQPVANPARGLFLTPFICPECGCVELYLVGRSTLTKRVTEAYGEQV